MLVDLVPLLPKDESLVRLFLRAVAGEAREDVDEVDAC